MKDTCKIENPLDTPFGYTISMIGGKWKLVILYQLKCKSVMRYSELKRTLTGITHKMLSQQLKELEVNRLIIRKEYPQVPPKVEYSLSERGLSLSKIMEDICNWGHVHIND
ncbi:MAG: helix-turn-helix domain-containing protein [Clostridium beijerinckii]